MVSIILCTYNRASLLPRAITSVLNQTYTDIELIIIDDGSTDRTSAVVNKFRNKDKRIHYFFQQNKGLAKARNAGLRKARGYYITFVDSDDEYDGSHIEKRVHYMIAHPSVDMIHGGMTLLGPRSKHYVLDINTPTKKIHLRHCHVGGTFFFKRSILAVVKNFKTLPFGEDFNFFTRVEQSFTVRKVAYPTYLYHLDSDNRLCDIFTATMETR